MSTRKPRMKLALLAGVAGALVSGAAFADEAIETRATTTTTTYSYGAPPVLQPQTAPVVVGQEYTYTRIERPTEAAIPRYDSYERQPVTPMPQNNTLRTAPQPEVNPNGIRYMSGGVGADEQARFRAAEAEYPVKLVFANSNGAFMSNLDITVTDRSGNRVLGMTTDGPILLMDLEPGSYNVKADGQGQTQTRTITVPDNGIRTYTLHFKATGPQDYSMNTQ